MGTANLPVRRLASKLALEIGMTRAQSLITKERAVAQQQSLLCAGKIRKRDFKFLFFAKKCFMTEDRLDFCMDRDGKVRKIRLKSS